MREVVQRDLRMLLIVCVILLIGALLRTHDLGAKPYWLDESISVFQAERSLGDIMEMMRDDMAQPLHTLLLKGWISLFGTTETATRALSAALGVLLILLVYLLGTELFDTRVGTIAAAFSAVSPSLIWFSQEIRPYMLFAVLTVGSYYAFVRNRRTGSRVSASMYVCTSIALLYTNAYGTLVIGTQGVMAVHHILSQRDRARAVRHWSLVYGLMLLAFLPGLRLLLYQYLNNRVQLAWIPPLDVRELSGIAIQLIGSAQLVIVSAALLLAMLLTLRWRHRDGAPVLLLLLWICIPAFALIIHSIVSTPLLVYRYVLFFVPAYCILLAYAVHHVGRLPVMRIILGVSLVALMLSATFQIYGAPDKADWRGAAAYLTQHSEADAHIMIHPAYQQVPFAYYYGPDCFHPPTPYRYEALRTCMVERHNVFSPITYDGCCTPATPVIVEGTRNTTLDAMTDGVVWLLTEEYAHDTTALAYLRAHKNLTREVAFSKITLYRFA